AIRGPQNPPPRPLPEPRYAGDRRPDDVGVRAVDPLDEPRRQPLNSVRTSLVDGLPRRDITGGLSLAHPRHANAGRFNMHQPPRTAADTQPGQHVVGPSR